jgi:hypothetical protein
MAQLDVARALIQPRLPWLATVCDRAAGKPNTLVELFALLQNLAEDRDGIPLLTQFVPRTVAALVTHAQDERVTESALRFAWNLSATRDNTAVLPVVTVMGPVMDAHAGNGDVTDAAMGALRNLSLQQSHGPAVAPHIPRVLRGLLAQHEQPTLLDNVRVFLTSVAGCRALFTAGPVVPASDLPLVMSALTDVPFGDGGVARQLLRLLEHMAPHLDEVASVLDRLLSFRLRPEVSAGIRPGEFSDVVEALLLREVGAQSIDSMPCLGARRLVSPDPTHT